VKAFEETQVGATVVVHDSLEFGGDGDVEFTRETLFKLPTRKTSSLNRLTALKREFPLE
jgi:hypothetical protein